MPTMRNLHTAEYSVLPMAFTPDGNSLVFLELSPDNNVYALQLDDSGEATGVTPLVQTDGSEEAAMPSFDGRLLAYESGRAGRREIYVRELATERVIQVSTRGGMEPSWSRTSNELFFITQEEVNSNEWQVYVTTYEVDDDGEFSPGTPVKWVGGTGEDYDLHPDGQRLLVRKLAEVEDGEDNEQQTFDHVVLFQHFDEHLRQLVPTGKK